MWRRTVGLVVLVLTGACTGDSSGVPAGTVEVRDSAGVQIVESRAAAWEGGNEWGISAEPVVRIGEVDADDPAYLLSRPSATTRLSDGRLVVLEAAAHEVRWFGPDGSHLATGGGQGEGPHEFRSAFAMLRLPGDTIVVEDRPRIKHVIFGPDGEFVRAETLDAERLASMGPRQECADFTLPDRSLVLCRPEPGEPPRSSDPGPGYLRHFTRFVRVPWSLEGEERLGLYGGIEQWGVERGDGRTTFGIHPFHSRTATAAGGDPLRIAIALNPEYSIELWTPEGRLERIVRRPGGESIATDEQRESAREQFLERMSDDAVRNRFRTEMAEPDTIPSVFGLTIGEEGDLWVWRHPWTSSATGDRFEGTRYDVFDPDGAYLGEVVLPGAFVINEVGRDYVLGVRYDEMGVPAVELYDLER